MLFTSLEFIFAFLPIVLIGFFLIANLFGKKAGAIFLAAASLFFYGWWSTKYIALLLTSIVFNYSIGCFISMNQERSARARLALFAGVTGNLLLLCYYKYSNFFLGEIARATGMNLPTLYLVLPLGISFFSFTQIAFLVDTWRKTTEEYNFWHYLLFVTWFPHLIAGPILHHKQMMPQFKNPEIYRIRSRNVAIGIILFFVGLSKKLLLADPISAYADPVFNAVALGQAVDIWVAWVGALAYTFQIYFDFSGYSDMAVGLSILFGIKLPINFNSPYKAQNIIEFWRRWHMTLSQFLRDYLYIPLGGSRKGEVRKLNNLMATMLLGGLWHGANWTFIIWGALHGAYLCVNHLWHKLTRNFGLSGIIPRILAAPSSILLTFILVVVAWVFFRADSVHSAHMLINSMTGRMEGASWGTLFPNLNLMTFIGYALLSMIVIWAFPNIYEWLAVLENVLQNSIKIDEYSGARVSQAFCILIAVVCTTLGIISILTTFGTNINSPFLYFQF
ncbi:MBOAT family O-acyltransferase [Legionella genomosp. 1]|uniref:MBOAT family O-acyltransferase n=1 Tax=Legionella genomosp. 1 TaxID=1093625 RepID=UPI00105426A6|nr:MBOAT family protein [Legionella genomosp. 1]